MRNLYKIFDRKVFLTAFFATIIIHGEMLFNKLAWHDEVSYLYSGWLEGLEHGRWFHYLLAKIVRKFSGMESTSLFMGIVVAACIGLIACIIFELFKVKGVKWQIPLILIFCSLPAVTGHFGYVGSSGYDFIGKLLCVISAYVLCEGIDGKKNIITFIISSTLFACSLGEYQCYLAFYLSILLIYFTQYLIQNEVSWKLFWSKAIYYVGAALVGLFLYLGILQIFLRLFGQQLTSYAGTDTYGIVSISEYVDRVIYAFKDFINPNMGATYNMFPFHWSGWHISLLVILTLLALILLVLKFVRHQYRSALQCLLCFLLLPLALNFNFVLYGAGATHSLHMYHFVLLFVYLYILMNGIIGLLSERFHFDKYAKVLIKGIQGIVVAIVLIFGVLYVRYDNYCYMQIEIRQEATISYFTTLITRIQSVDGYNDEYPIAFINEFEKKNLVDNVSSRSDLLTINPYGGSIVNNYNWKAFMSQWCGYEPEYVDGSIYEESEIIKGMSSYPDDGSICIIDNIIVVKF